MSLENDPLPAEILSDMEAVAGGSRDPELVRRVTERSEKAQAELLQKHGVREIVVELIRETRDE